MATPEVNAAKEGKLAERLDQIRSQPKLQSQQQTGVVLQAVEDTLRDQKSDFTPTAYFAALLSLLNQYVSSSGGIVNKDVATAVVYLLDLITPHVPQPLLRAKFTNILNSLAPALSHNDADAPFLRSAVGCLVSLLIGQDAQAWALPQSQVSPRQAVAGLLALAMDPRPKVRKRAQEGLATVMQNKPPTPSRDHPAADMCAETALRTFEQLSSVSAQAKKGGKTAENEGEPALIHSMQLIKTLAAACGGWPSRSLESLCTVLFSVARSKSNFLTMTAFDVFESILAGMADEEHAEKVPRLLDIIGDLQPSQNDSQLLPPWIAIVSRGYDVYSQVEPEEAFSKLPDAFQSIANFLASPSHNIRISASECLVSFCVNCVPATAILEPSIFDEKTMDKLGGIVTDLFSVKYQSAWMEVFTVLSAMFENLKWRSFPLLGKALATVGELRSSDSFASKDKADAVIGAAIAAAGPDNALSILPLNIGKAAKGVQGRAWMLPLIRDYTANTNLGHFKKELVPLSELLYQKVMEAGENKTMETKIFETLVNQIWSCLPAYCDRPLDLKEAFDQTFAEMLSKLLYQQPEMRLTICRSLQTLVEGFQAIANLETEDDLILQGRISKQDAIGALDFLSQYSGNLLAVLFNVYGETSTQQRGPILNCIDAYLSVTKPAELSSTFDKVATMLDTTMKEPKEEAVSKPAKGAKALPPTSHALMDIVVAMSVHLPRESCQALFAIAALLISRKDEPQLQKKAYKLIPRLATSEIGRAALQERNADLRNAIVNNAENTAVQARKDRLVAIGTIIEFLPETELSFLAGVLPEVILGTKETNEKAREAAYELIIAMGEKMEAGGSVTNETGTTQASIDEYFTMISAGLAGTSPHMISATVTALSRSLFEFHSKLSQQATEELVQTMDLFLKSPTREVVRSVLGFIKVCVLALPIDMMKRRLDTLVPSLMSWSHEHKAHFRAKVKNILERMIRRYGVQPVENNCPTEDRKLIANIRKTRDRRKRKRTGEEGESEDDESQAPGHAKAAYGNEFDEAIYGSDSDASDDDGESRPAARSARAGKKASQQTFIHEDDDEPLDLLDKKSLAHMSSTRPLQSRQPPQRRRTKTDADGKLVLGEDEDSDDDQFNGVDLDKGSLEGGIDAYVNAIRGRDAPKRGRGGRLKFSNKREAEDEEEAMEIDGEEKRKKPMPGWGNNKSPRGQFNRSPRGDRGRGGFGGGRGGVQKGRGRGGGRGGFNRGRGR